MKITSNLSYITVYRQYFLEWKKVLSDQEVIFLEYYAMTSVWDVRYESFGVSDKLNKEIAVDLNCSAGKVSEVTNGLIEKGFLERIRQSELRVTDYAIRFRPKERKPKVSRPIPVQKNETIIQKTENDVRQGEIVIQKNETNNIGASLQKIRNDFINGRYQRKDDKKSDENLDLNNLKQIK